ncbi:hypothetical protein ACFSMW_09765 [Virgibacillus halophilus]|uniref:DUF4083 domain-containing protein n=1 Tax=Tigheibacillus halophilus TaxID=361280 RepID=A0ABU5C4Q9_9BACI|nr:hypothetical protein [Virgibacillus halophilus]
MTTTSPWADWLLYVPMIINLFYLVVTVFGIYFAFKVIKFMNTKIRLDKEKNEKLNKLIADLNQEKEVK